ncbi:hypothetical protein APHAL10511_003613 [Amanita phalloides]|nr:hypothetical protein APHAL10511_003613 [Amanita phalloides]
MHFGRETPAEAGGDTRVKPVVRDLYPEGRHPAVGDAYFSGVGGHETRSKADKSTHVSLQDASALGVGINVGESPIDARDTASGVPSLDKHSRASIKVNQGLEKSVTDSSHVSKSEVAIPVEQLTEPGDRVPAKVPQALIKLRGIDYA